MTAPQPESLLVEGHVFVSGEDGDGQHVHGDIEIFLPGEELEAEADGLFLEIIAQRPVAQHFKEGAVACVADLVYIACADAFLHVGKAVPRGMLCAEQVGNQRVHARHGEQRGGIVFGNERCGGDYGVSPLAEKAKIKLAKLLRGQILHIKLPL